MIDSSLVNDAKDGLNLLYYAASAVFALITFIGGKIHERRKRK